MKTDLEDLKGLIEAYIFSQTEPVSEQSIESLLEKNSINLNPEGKATVSILDIIHSLQEDYAYRGIRLCKVAGGWQFRTAQEWTAYLVKIIARPKRLSSALHSDRYRKNSRGRFKSNCFGNFIGIWSYQTLWT